jgi:hypothetical protein
MPRIGDPATNSLLAEDVYHHPIWASLLQIVLAIGIVALSTFIRSAFSNSIKALIFTGTALVFLALDYWAMSHWSVTLNLVPHVVALLASWGLMWALGSRPFPGSQAASPAISMDTLKTLALTLHGRTMI